DLSLRTYHPHYRQKMSTSSLNIDLRLIKEEIKMYTKIKELLTLAILEKMNAYYQANARESEDFSCFNKKKNLTKESIENFQIGFAIKHSLFLDQLSPLEIDILTMIGMTKSYPSSNQIHDLF